MPNSGLWTANAVPLRATCGGGGVLNIVEPVDIPVGGLIRADDVQACSSREAHPRMHADVGLQDRPPQNLDPRSIPRADVQSAASAFRRASNARRRWEIPFFSSSDISP